MRRSKSFFGKFKFRNRRGQKRTVSKPQAIYPPEVHSMLRDKNLNQDMVKNVNNSSVFAYQTPFWRVELVNGQVWDIAQNKQMAINVAIENTMLQLHNNPSEFDEDFLKTMMFNQQYFDDLNENYTVDSIETWRQMGWREKQEYLLARGLSTEVIDSMIELDPDLNVMLDDKITEEYYVEKLLGDYNPLHDQDYLSDVEILNSGNDKKINEFVRGKYKTAENYREVAREFISVEGINIALSDEVIIHSPSSTAVYWKRS